MKTPKLTPWIDGSINPVRAGVYQRDFSVDSDESPYFSKWDGEKWGMGALTPCSAELESAASLFQNLPWRGLAQNPNSTK